MAAKTSAVIGRNFRLDRQIRDGYRRFPAEKNGLDPFLICRDARKVGVSAICWVFSQAATR